MPDCRSAHDNDLAVLTLLCLQANEAANDGGAMSNYTDYTYGDDDYDGANLTSTDVVSRCAVADAAGSLNATNATLAAEEDVPCWQEQCHGRSPDPSSS